MGYKFSTSCCTFTPHHRRIPSKSKRSKLPMPKRWPEWLQPGFAQPMDGVSYSFHPLVNHHPLGVFIGNDIGNYIGNPIHWLWQYGPLPVAFPVPSQQSCGKLWKMRPTWNRVERTESIGIQHWRTPAAVRSATIARYSKGGPAPWRKLSA